MHSVSAYLQSYNTTRIKQTHKQRADKLKITLEQTNICYTVTNSSINAVNMTSSSESTLIAGKAEMYNLEIGGSKPSQIISAHDKKRRPYNSSKRNTHTTLLNANPNNFRAIVQKFTGRSASIDTSVERKGPVTLDFRSPASVSKEVIFPSSGNIQNHDCAINTHVGDGEGHVTCGWEVEHTVHENEMGQLSEDYEIGNGGSDDYADHDNCDYHNDDHDLIMKEYLEDSSFNGVFAMEFDDFYYDAVMVEEFLMRDLDI